MTEKRRLFSKIFISVLSGFCFLTPAFGSELFIRPLADVVPKAKVILKGKVDSKITEITEPNETVEGFYAISVEKVMFGNLSAQKIKAKYTSPDTDIRRGGKIIGWHSLTIDASGIEFNVREGSTYIFLFGSDIKSQDSYNELLRIESVDKEEEILEILEGFTTTSIPK